MQGTGLDNVSPHRFVAYNASGDVWDGAAYVTWNINDPSSYFLPADQIGDTAGYVYGGSEPSGMARWELWYWAGQRDGSFAVDAGPGAAAAGGSGGVVRNVSVVQRQNYVTGL